MIEVKYWYCSECGFISYIYMVSCTACSKKSLVFTYTNGTYDKLTGDKK